MSVRTQRDGAIGWIVLDNPAKRNAINGGMWRAIPPAMKGFDADPGLRCVVIRGAGTEAFAAGADISEFEQARASQEAVRGYDGALEATLAALEGSPRPVLAMIHGYCFGGGLEIALACDLRYSGESGQFAIPAARLSIGYGVRGTSRLVATVGHTRAREILYTGRRLDAREALSIGLVNGVTPDSELEDRVREIASQLAENAPLSIQASKAVIEAVVEPHGDFSRANEAVRRCASSEDYKEGRRAFMEKRKPRFQGK